MEYLQCIICSLESLKLEEKPELHFLHWLGTIVFLYTINTYNWLCHFFVLAAIYLEGTDIIKKVRLKDIVVGIALGLVFLSKQSIGVYCLITYAILKLLKERKISKELILHYLCSAIGFWTTLIPFIIYLINNNCFNEFWDLCFCGMLSFASDNLLSNYGVAFIGVALLIFNIINAVICYKNNKKFELTMSLFNIAFIGYLYPIFDTSHMFFGILPSLLLVLNTIWKAVRKNHFLASIVNGCYGIFITYFLVIMVIVSASLIKKSYQSVKYQGRDSFYNYTFGFSEDYIKLYNSIYDYIQQKKLEGYDAVAVTPYAPLIFMSHNDFNMKYDILLTGNFGKNGDQNVIDYLEKLEKPLIIHSYQYSYQESTKIHKYITNNYMKIDVFDDALYEVYTKE